MSDDHTDAPLSKSARKRAAEAAQVLGRRLTQLKPDQLTAMDLPGDLAAAIADYQRFTSHGAQRRQLQFIGRLMRDADIDAISSAVDALEGQSASARAQFAQTERWREALLAEQDAMTQFIAQYPDVDRQMLRQLVKKVRSANTEQQRKSQARTLFRYLAEVIDGEGNSE